MSEPADHPNESPVPDAGEFDSLLAMAQPRLKGYVASILGGWSDVDDLVQETNMVLLHKRDTFEPGTNFIAWAFRVAYFKATTWRRDRMREGRVVLSEHAFQEIAGYAEDYFTIFCPVEEELEHCLKLLPPDERELVHVKYVEGTSLVDHAAVIGRSAVSLQKKISRIRIALRACLRKRLIENHEAHDFL